MAVVMVMGKLFTRGPLVDSFGVSKVHSSIAEVPRARVRDQFG